MTESERDRRVRLLREVVDDIRATRPDFRASENLPREAICDRVPHAPHGLDPDDELLRLARAGEIRLGRPNSEAVYARPPKEERLPHDEVMALLDAVRGDR